jgi:hypothetical protein
MAGCFKELKMNKLKVCEMILIWTLILSGCAPGMPIGANEVLPLTSQQLTTGVYSVFSGAQPIAWMFQHASGLRILVWPGATNGAQTLINVACIEQCPTGWEHFVVSNGFAMTGQRASDFVAYLKSSGWQQLPPVLASVAAKGQTVADWMSMVSQSLSGFFIVVPVTPGMMPTESGVQL